MKRKLSALIIILILFYQLTIAVYAFPDTETLRPNAAGYYTQLVPTAGKANWDCVDETPSDSDTTRVKTKDIDGSSYADLYNIPNSAIPAGSTINSVTVYMNVKSESATYKSSWKIYLKTNSAYAGGSWVTPGTSYTVYSKAYLTNPITGLAWTIAEIDALQIGEIGESGLDFDYLVYRIGYCTQCWVEIDYTAGAPPEERSYSFTETMKPSASLNRWQEQSRSFTETFILTAASNQWQEHGYVFEQTIKSSETVTYWQEQIYGFVEPTKLSDSLFYLEEITMFFFEYIETIHATDIFLHEIAGSIINYVALALGSLGFILCLYPLTGDDDSTKALAVVTLILSLAGVAFAILGLSYALGIGAVAFVLSIVTIAMVVATKKD